MNWFDRLRQYPDQTLVVLSIFTVVAILVLLAFVAAANMLVGR